MQKTTFGVWDCLVFGLMLVASLGIGIYHAVRGKNQTTSDYLVAGGSMTFVPVALSLLATYTSSIMMLGTPAEGYVYGVSWILGEVFSEIGAILEIVLIMVFVKRLALTTPYEFLERRFGSRKLRVFANIISCFSLLRYMSTVLYGQGVALQTMTGLSKYTSICVTAGAAVVYTAIGGLKAVIWTDVLQFAVIVCGLLSTTIMGTVQAGGITRVWSLAADSGRLGFSLDPDPTVRHTVWNLSFGRILSGFGYVLGPAAMQRIVSTRSLKDARRSFLLTTPGFTLLIATALAEGVVAFAYFVKKGCDPLQSKQIESPNQVIPFFIMDLFRDIPGLSGFFLAALASAALSTISSSLSAIAAITWYDLLKPCLPHVSEFRSLIVAKTTVVVFGIAGCFAAVVVSLAGSSTLNQISYTLESVTYQPLTGLFYLGALFPFVNTKGAVTGFVSGIGFMTWLTLGSMLSPNVRSSTYLPLGPTDQCHVVNATSIVLLTTTSPLNITTVGSVSSERSGLDNFYSLSYTVFSSVALSVVILVGVVASLLTGGLKTPANPDLVIKLSDIQFIGRKRGHDVDNEYDNMVPQTHEQMTSSKIQTESIM